MLSYKPGWLVSDVFAGLVLSTMVIPVGVAYSVASGLPPINGLYATIIPMIVYAIFGPSKILVLGPDSSLAPVILGVVFAASGGDPERAVPIAAAMAVVSGLVCMVAGFGRLGFVTELLSKPIRYGYMNGIALAVIISQLSKVFGFSIDNRGPIRDLWAIVENVMAGKANWIAAGLGFGTFALVRLTKRYTRMPGILAAVVIAAVVVALFDLSSEGVKILGTVPQGLPKFAFPSFSAAGLNDVVAGGLAVAVVSFADTSVLSRTFAARAGARVDPNQEMVGLGAANFAAGFFQGFPISSSSSRTPVVEAAGGRTQLASVVAAAVVAVVIMFAPALFRNLPYAALAGVVISAAIGLFEFDDLARIYRIQRWEFWLSIACTIGVAVFGAMQGIGIAIVIAVLEFLWDGWRPHSAVLGRPAGVPGFHDTARYPKAELVPGIVLFRWDAPLFFANAELFNGRVLEAIDRSAPPVHHIVVSAAPITSVDVTAADALLSLEQTLGARGIELCFAELKDPVKDKLKRFGLFTRFGEARFYPTIDSAVESLGERSKPRKQSQTS